MKVKHAFQWILLIPPCDTVSIVTTVSRVTPFNVAMASFSVSTVTFQMVHKTDLQNKRRASRMKRGG